VSELEVRHFARREHREAAAGLHPPLRRLEPAHAAADGVRAAERIDRDHGVAQLGDAMQEVVAEQLHVGTDAPQQRVEGQAVDAAERMVGDHDERPRGRHARQVRRRDVERNP